MLTKMFNLDLAKTSSGNSEMAEARTAEDDSVAEASENYHNSASSTVVDFQPTQESTAAASDKTVSEAATRTSEATTTTSTSTTTTTSTDASTRAVQQYQPVEHYNNYFDNFANYDVSDYYQDENDVEPNSWLEINKIKP